MGSTFKVSPKKIVDVLKVESQDDNEVTCTRLDFVQVVGYCDPTSTPNRKLFNGIVQPLVVFNFPSNLVFIYLLWSPSL